MTIFWVVVLAVALLAVLGVVTVALNICYMRHRENLTQQQRRQEDDQESFYMSHW
jgi:heme/copper-type cytochrome/quinol oxidase subunit 2